MTLRKEDYKPRLIDDKIEQYLKVFGALKIQGPKWCGKTWTSLAHSNSVTYLTDIQKRNLAEMNPMSIFEDERPQLLDEWQIVPQIWDAVRHECDKDHEKGKFILTGSTSFKKQDGEAEIFHSGAGRIASLEMSTMSLYEAGWSSGEFSIKEMLDGADVAKNINQPELEQIAEYIIRGGWPENINTPRESMALIPRQYIEAVVENDINERKDRKRDADKMRMLFRSLARNESTVASDETILKDIIEHEKNSSAIESRQTVADYTNVLDGLFITDDQLAFSVNYRSSTRVGKTAKRHFVDPSLACASLGLSVEKLMSDFRTFGMLFESLAVRDLRVYMDTYDGKVYHFRDNVSGDEVDAILEFSDGEYAAVEIKLGHNGINEAKESLMKFYDKVEKKPKFMCVIVGYVDAIVRDPETGIYIVPLLTLKP